MPSNKTRPELRRAFCPFEPVAWSALNSLNKGLSREEIKSLMQQPDRVPHVPEKSYGGARGMRPIDVVQLDERV